MLIATYLETALLLTAASALTTTVLTLTITGPAADSSLAGGRGGRTGRRARSILAMFIDVRGQGQSDSERTHRRQRPCVRGIVKRRLLSHSPSAR
jgi:hypothetical protein